MLDTFILYNDLCLEIEVLKEQLKLVETELQYWLGVKFHDKQLDGIPLGAIGVNKFGANTAIIQSDEKINTLNKLRKRLEKLEKTKEKLNSLMGKFEGLDYKVAYMRYVEGKSLKEIAGELDYSYQYVREVMSKIKQAI